MVPSAAVSRISVANSEGPEISVLAAFVWQRFLPEPAALVVHLGSVMKNKSALRVCLLLIAIVALPPVAILAQTSARLSDAEVKNLLEQVYEARDKFEGNLDNSVKNSMMKTATTDAKVETVLQDLQDNAAKLRDRFKPEYAAGAEAETLLKHANMISAAMDRAAIVKGRSQWDRLVASLKSLAGVYGTTFPLPRERACAA